MVRRWLYEKRTAEQALRDIKDDIYLVDSRNLTSEGYLRDGGWGAISPESDWAREHSEMGKRVQELLTEARKIHKKKKTIQRRLKRLATGTAQLPHQNVSWSSRVIGAPGSTKADRERAAMERYLREIAVYSRCGKHLMGYNISEKVPMPRALNLAPPETSSITGKSANHPLEMDVSIAQQPTKLVGAAPMAAFANWRHAWAFNGAWWA